MNKANSQLSLKHYFDYQATTPTDPRVLDAMMPYFFENFGNPASTSHEWGWRAEAAVQVARAQVAHLIGATPREILFTSGATESNNLAIKGFCAQNEKPIVTTTIEHKSSSETVTFLEDSGCNLHEVKIDDKGWIDLKALDTELGRTAKKGLCTFIGAHNEIGTIQPIEAISKVCRKHGWILHIDGAQAIGKIPVNVQTMGIDMLSLSGHKMYGPKGIGALFVRRKDPRVELNPCIHGGGQEYGLRSGTLPVPLIVGLGRAAELAHHEMANESQKLSKLRNQLWDGIRTTFPKVTLNGPTPENHQRLPHNLNVTFEGIDAQALLLELKGFALSTSSACGSGITGVSSVLKGIGKTDQQIHGTVRFGLGRWSNEEGVKDLLEALQRALSKLK